MRRGIEYFASLMDVSGHGRVEMEIFREISMAELGLFCLLGLELPSATAGVPGA